MVLKPKANRWWWRTKPVASGWTFAWKRNRLLNGNVDIIKACNKLSRDGLILVFATECSL